METENTLHIKPRELSFLLKCTNGETMHLFDLVAARMREDYSELRRRFRKEGLPLEVIEKNTGQPLGKIVEDIRTNYLRRRETRSFILNHQPSIKKKRFTGKALLLKKFLAPEDQQYILENWKQKHQALSNQLHINEEAS